MKNKKFIFVMIVVAALLSAGSCVVGYFYGWFGEHLVLVRTDFEQLPGWERDDKKGALQALQKSCAVLAKRDPSKPFKSEMPQSGKVEDWHKVCAAIDSVDKNNSLTMRKFFEFWFEPYQVTNNFNPEGLFTGYYLPTLKCSLNPDERYTAPIYAIPDDLVKVDLGLFDEQLKGRTLVGQAKNHQLRLYPKREAIERGDITDKTKILFWCDDKVEVAFAQIQGSAIVQLPDGKQFLINYDTSNGRSYAGIGRYMVKNRYLTLQHSSMQDIRAWLIQHPDKMDFILNQNASYVFFRVLKDMDPLGAQQVALIPECSLAVDKRYIPLGAPIWLDTTVIADASHKVYSLQRLLIAQDTGGAIKGMVRGDVYWGGGERAAFIAGHMKNRGEYWILLPRKSLEVQ